VRDHNCRALFIVLNRIEIIKKIELILEYRLTEVLKHIVVIKEEGSYSSKEELELF